MKSADQWLDQYGESHQNPTNKLIHWVCIPAIMVSLLGLLVSIPMPWSVAHINPATLFVAFAVGFYSLLSKRLMVGMAVVGFGCYALALALGGLPIPLWVTSLGIFVVAWIFQFIGHKIEGAKPSFFEDLQFLLIGPMWLLSFIYGKLGIRY
ncbi:MAG: DUF962 domain-containing protein [Nannocystaceae bacterium]|nr:DUF962 domain-containing protein [bacterium]